MAVVQPTGSEYFVNPQPEEPGCWQKVQLKMDRIRDFLADTCCSCFKKVPSIVVALALLSVVLFLLALIPFLIILTSSIDKIALPQQEMPILNNEKAIEWTFDSPDDDELLRGDRDGEFGGISTKQLYPSNVTTCIGFGFACTNEPDLVVSTAQRCDGTRDCPDGSDELNCPALNATEQSNDCALRCNGECIPESAKCDGKKDCPSGEDEQGCDCRACSGSDVALCSDGTCIKRSQVCDGIPDCTGGMDEEGCPGQCSLQHDPSSVIKCADNLFYPIEEACSGRIKQCARSCIECDERHAFTCKKEHKCISMTAVCDGNHDCQGGEDEVNCECDFKNEDKFVFKCLTSSKCLVDNQICDGVWDCEDHSDERDCETCPRNMIRCGRKCLPPYARCDGRADCTDGVDELNCTCEECVGRHSDTYFCQGSKRCLLRSEVCAPYTTCTNPTEADKAYCASRALGNRGLW